MAEANTTTTPAAGAKTAEPEAEVSLMKHVTEKS